MSELRDEVISFDELLARIDHFKVRIVGTYVIKTSVTIDFHKEEIILEEIDEET